MAGASGTETVCVAVKFGKEVGAGPSGGAAGQHGGSWREVIRCGGHGEGHGRAGSSRKEHVFHFMTLPGPDGIDATSRLV